MNIIEIVLTDTHLKEDNLNVNKSIFKQSLEYARERRINRILHLGDIFDSRKAQTLEILKDGFMDILDMFTEYGITLVAIPGNHDKTDCKSKKSFLDVFVHHPAFELIDDYKSMDKTLIDSYIYHFIPYFSAEEYMERLRKAQACIDTDKVNVLFTHIGITGAVMNNGIKVEGIASSEFNGFDRVLVGHYHDEQNLNSTICYVGASIQHNYGEKSSKGLIVLDGIKTTLVELDSPRYHNIEMNVESLTQLDVDSIIKEKNSGEDNIRITLTGPKEKVKAFNKKALLLAGVSVETKIDVVEREEIVERVEPLTPLTLLSSFESFCDEKKLDKPTGVKYLKNILNS